MRKRKYILLPLLLAVGTTTLNAGDEDMSPSAYHVFDPETGYMITVDPMEEEQFSATATDNVPPEVKTTALGAWQYWIATIVVAGGIAAWLYRRRESHD